MDLTTTQELNRSYLILTASNQELQHSYQLDLLTSNIISGFLPCSVLYSNDHTEIRYDITSKQTLLSFFHKKEPDKKLLVEILSEIFSAILTMQDYLLDEQFLIMDPEYIYISPDPLKVFLCFAPADPRDFRTELNRFIEQLLGKIDRNDNGAVMLGYELFRKTLDPGFIIDDLYKILFSGEVPGRIPVPDDHSSRSSESFDDIQLMKDIDSFYFSGSEDDDKVRKAGKLNLHFDIDKKKILGIIKILGVLMGIIGIIYAAVRFSPDSFPDFSFIAGALILAASGALIFTLKKKQKETSDFFPDARKKSSSGNVASSEMRESPDIGNSPPFVQKSVESLFVQNTDEEYTELFNDSDALTEYMCEETRNHAYLIPFNTSVHNGSSSSEKQIIICEDNVIVGKNPRAADIVISDSTVSRIHAGISLKNCEYSVVDLNSRNGTFVNGEKITPDTPHKLVSGDIVSFASAEYIFNTGASSQS